MSKNSIAATDLLEALRAEPWAGPGPVVRELRRGQGLRLKDLADRAGISIGYLSRLERSQTGGDNPSMANLESLARALGVPLLTLLPPRADQPAAEERELAESLVGREVLQAVTFRQPVTLPVLERLCVRVADRREVRAALDHLVARGLVRALPPSAPGRPIFYVAEWERHL